MTTLTQGGQTTIHTFRMNVVIFRFILKFFLIVITLSIITTFFIKTDKETLINTQNYYQAKIISLYQKDKNHKITIIKYGRPIQEKIKNLLQNRSLISSANKTTNDVKQSLKLGTIISSISTLLLIIYFIIKGSLLNQSTHLRGGNIVKPKILRNLIKRYNRRTLFLPRLVYKIRRLLVIMNLLDKSKPYNQKQKQYVPYNITNKIPYPAHTETQHTLITGGSGTGKTQMLKHLLSQIKAKGDRAIVYDKMGSFIPHFYEEEKGDTILNPFDKRSPIWSIFNEVEEPLQLDSIASALMPITKNISDPFWVQASRTIFTSVANKMKQQGETSNKNLIDNLLKIDLSDIAEMIKGTPAQAIIDERSPKTALSVMSVLSTYLSSLKYLKDTSINNIDTNGELQKPFSIRNWVKDDDNSSFLFISSRGDQHESLKPLISTWLEIGINSLLSIKQNRNRRIWVILDELPSLHMLPSLNSGIAESRQFGGCFVLSLQLMAQLRSIYGKDDAETISGLAKTRVIFSSPDEDTARWCSNSLGKKEQKEIRRNISYGAHDVRDGVSLNTHQSTENLVIPTEIMNLHNLECYLKLPFNFPITKTKIKVHKSKEIAERFIRDCGVEVKMEGGQQSIQNRNNALFNDGNIDANYNQEETNNINNASLHTNQNITSDMQTNTTQYYTIHNQTQYNNPQNGFNTHQENHNQIPRPPIHQNPFQADEDPREIIRRANQQHEEELRAKFFQVEEFKEDWGDGINTSEKQDKITIDDVDCDRKKTEEESSNEQNNNQSNKLLKYSD